MPQTKTQKRETVATKLEAELAELKTDAYRDRLIQHYGSVVENPVEHVRKIIAQRDSRISTDLANLKKKLGRE